MNLTPHPRLYIRPALFSRACSPRSGDSRTIAAISAIEAAAREFAPSPQFPWDPANGHNAHLIRARIMQTRIVTLLAAWLRSGEDRVRAAVLSHVAAMADWKDWSWVSWRQGKTDPTAEFDLSYGENCATLALAFDLLAPTLSAAEKRLFLDQASTRALASFSRHTDPATPAWWLNQPDCNWQPVCAGGGGMLALALAGELPDLEPLIARANVAVTRYMEKADSFGGGCVEGLAYWNYGMRYAFMFLLGHEAATGKPHPVFSLPGIRDILRFPLDFSPQGIPCGFGDINEAWSPLPFHFAAASRLGDRALLAALDTALPPAKITPSADGPWPLASELLLLRPQGQPARRSPARKTAPPRLHLFPGMDWGLLAGAAEHPRLNATIRGGATTGPHNHLDLFSFHLVCDGEAFITSVSNTGYLDTTFSDRRFDIWEMRPDAKNVPFIGGVGIAHPATVNTVPIRLGPCRGFHLRGPDAIRISLYNKPLVKELDRLFLILEDKAFLVIDRMALAAPNRYESRFHTLARVEPRASCVRLNGRHARMTLTTACTVPFLVTTGQGAPNNPLDTPTTLVRIFSRDLVPSLVLASVFTPGAAPARAELTPGPRGRCLLHVRGKGFDVPLNLPFPFNQE